MHRNRSGAADAIVCSTMTPPHLGQQIERGSSAIPVSEQGACLARTVVNNSNYAYPDTGTRKISLDGEKISVWNAGARGRTEMTLRSNDFESFASASSATPARREKYIRWQGIAVASLLAAISSCAHPRPVVMVPIPAGSSCRSGGLKW